MSISVIRAKDIVRNFNGRRILVVGDLMLDRYVIGNENRISPEAPVPVVHVAEESCRAGGAANVALNIRSLGGTAIVAGVVGADGHGDELIAALKSSGIKSEGVLRSDKIRTTVKTRIIGERQQIVRVDREEDRDAVLPLLREYCDTVAALVQGVDGVVVEDYGKGVIRQEIVDAILRVTAETGITVGYDPKDNHDLAICKITIATPNYKEAMIAAGLPEIPLRGDPMTDARLKRAGEVLMEKWQPEMLAITLGPHGMYLIEGRNSPCVIATKAKEVFDVCGAGDAVIGTYVLAHAAGATYQEAACLANHVAGVVVGKLGAATCSLSELVASVGAEGGAV